MLICFPCHNALLLFFYSFVAYVNITSLAPGTAFMHLNSSLSIRLAWNTGQRTVQNPDLETTMHPLQRQLCSIPGCQNVFVLQLFHFSYWHGNNNVVDVVHTHSLPFANEPLKGNRVQVKQRAMWLFILMFTHSRSYIPKASWRLARFFTFNLAARQEMLLNLCFAFMP